MATKTPWEEASNNPGETESERVLIKLARKAFLSLWSYPNVFTDEGQKNGKGDGKELCDLLVVFGNDVLLFSDEHCAFQNEKDISLAWSRWYRRAIEKSANQLSGAEAFIKKFPKRVFLDKQCRTALPIELPDASEARYHLLAVTRGSNAAAQKHFGAGGSGTLILFTELVGQAAHTPYPFMVGYPLDSRRFVHVLDEVSVELLLDELDTVPDLVAYLRAKEALLQQRGRSFFITREEELLAYYLTNLIGDEHAFLQFPADADSVSLIEGGWLAYKSSVQREAKKKADSISYAWDGLIEHHSRLIRAGTAISLHPLSGASAAEGAADHERIIRAFAKQDRLSRRTLVGHMNYALQKNDAGQIFTRIFVSGGDRAYVFLTVPKPKDMTYSDYRASRVQTLSVYCNAIKDGMPMITEAIGIACEPLCNEPSSMDFLHVDLSDDMSEEERKLWRAAADDLGILQPKTPVVLSRTGEQRFPTPFAGSQYSHLAGASMNREQRRAAAKAKRRR